MVLTASPEWEDLLCSLSPHAQAGFAPEQGEASLSLIPHLQLARNGEGGFLDKARVSLQRKVSPAAMGISLSPCWCLTGKAEGELLCVTEGKWEEPPGEGNNQHPAAIAG